MRFSKIKPKTLLVILVCLLLLTYLSVRIYLHTKEISPSSVLIADKETILSLNADNIAPYKAVKWDGFSSMGYDNDVTDGIIPRKLFSDPIYCSMNLPSEAMSDFSESCNRVNGHTISLLTPAQTHAISIGAVYLESGKEMPSDFTICVGKMCLYAYSTSLGKWIVLDECPYPTALTMFELPWSNHSSYKCENVEYFDDHAEVHVKSDELDGHVFHFWGNLTPINQKDYKYYATAYEIWVKEGSAINILTTEGGIDAKDADSNNGIQMISSRSIELTTKPKECWCHTIPNKEYKDKYGNQLKSLFDK